MKPHEGGRSLMFGGCWLVVRLFARNLLFNVSSRLHYSRVSLRKIKLQGLWSIEGAKCCILYKRGRA